MLRVVNLERTGIFVVMRGGAVATLAGSSYWRSLDDVRKAARTENVAVSDLVVRTSM